MPEPTTAVARLRAWLARRTSPVPVADGSSTNDRDRPLGVNPDEPALAPALPDHDAPPGVVIIAGVDQDGRQYVLEDDPGGEPWVDPGYDDNDQNWVRYRPNWGGFARSVLLILLLIWMVFTAREWFYDWVDRQVEPSGPQGELVELSIPSGASTNSVATLLEGSGVISNSTVFRYWLRCDGSITLTGFLSCDSERTFKAGDYELNTNMAFDDVVAVLDEGPAPVEYARFTIPEGLRLPEVIERMVAVNPRFDQDDILEALQSDALTSEYFEANEYNALLRLEGTLFPATYDVAEERLGDEAGFLQRMADTFDSRFAALLAEVGRAPIIDELGLSNYDVIVVASLIEEEARVAVDRPLMSRAIYNRLAADMRLQIDASTYFAVGKSFTEPLLQSDLDNDSPWNTYAVRGLPPSPIAAPGEAALRAALQPTDGDYLFWARTDADGVVGAHTFSTTNAEHNEAVEVCRALGYC